MNTEHDHEQTTSSTNPLDPTAFMKMMQDMLDKSMTMLSGKGGSFAGMPMDLEAFTKNLEKMIAQMPGMNFAKDGNGMPMDPMSFMKALNERMGGMADPTQFFKMCDEMMKKTSGAFTGAGQDTSPADMMNPMWWFKKGEETFQQTANMMTGRNPNSH